MAAFEIVNPSYPATARFVNASKVQLEIGAPEDGDEPDWNILIPKFGFPIFQLEDNNYYVLIKHIAEILNFPSSYQLIAAFVARSGLPKDVFTLTTSKELNSYLSKSNAITKSEVRFKLFYAKLDTIYSIIKNKESLFVEVPVPSKDEASVPEVKKVEEKASQDPSKAANDEDDEDDDENGNDKEDEDEDDEEEDDDEEEEEEEKIVVNKRSDYKAASPNEKVTVSQAFPQYGLVDSSLQLNHATFNSLNSLTKLNYYKTLQASSYKFLPNSKLNFAERELVIRDHDYLEIQIEGDENEQQDRKRIRKPIGKSKKHNINIDPNSMDLAESVIPGQGYIQEFSVNHLCKVPNYYITSNQQNVSSSSSSTSLFNLKRINSASNSSFLFNENIKMSKNIQQLVFSNDSDTYHHSKYFYTKSYRGPGSGNYKDAALMNRINKIHLIADPLRVTHKTKISKSASKRYNQNLKGLIYEKYNKYWVDSVLNKQRKYTEDYLNLEILHNNLQFNLLVNSYREISEDTWQNYYKFKTSDYEQLRALQREHDEIELRNRDIEKRREWELHERERQEKLRSLVEQTRTEKENIQRERIQRQKDSEEKRRQRQLEATFNDPFSNESSSSIPEVSTSDLDEKERELDEKFQTEKLELVHPAPLPMPIETPQLDAVNRFTAPTFYPEIVKKLPMGLRKAVLHNKEDIPAIKKPVRYVTTYPDKNNPEILNRIEILKLPNSNSVGWDNLKKFHED